MVLFFYKRDGIDRFHFNAIVTQQDLDDTYLIPFKFCVTLGVLYFMLREFWILRHFSERAKCTQCLFPERRLSFHIFLCILGKVAGLMCSFNAVNGTPSCANKYLLSEMSREQWGFEVCGGVERVQNAQNYTKDPPSTIKAVLGAGMDSDCGSFIPTNLVNSMNKSGLVESDIDSALFDLAKVQMRLGFFDSPDSTPWRYGRK